MKALPTYLQPYVWLLLCVGVASLGINKVYAQVTEPSVEQQADSVAQATPPVEQQADSVAQVTPPVEQQADSVAQVTPPEKLLRRWGVGVFMTASLSRDFQLEATPVFELRIWNKLRLGVGAVYQIAVRRVIDPVGQSVDQRAVHHYGGLVYVSYQVWNVLMGYIEAGSISYIPSRLGVLSSRRFQPHLGLGIGVRVPLDKKRRFVLYGIALYDVLFRQNESPYRTPLRVRIGFLYQRG